MLRRRGQGQGPRNGSIVNSAFRGGETARSQGKEDMNQCGNEVFYFLSGDCDLFQAAIRLAVLGLMVVGVGSIIIHSNNRTFMHYRNNPTLYCLMSFVLGIFLAMVGVWAGPVAARDRIIADYEVQVIELAKKVETK